ncbi:hypothetical protein EG346_22045 [Chryseobacterium carnipullorum]|uniref:Uncharacterized protein n=1 Tax=Chryseobacterium carnipullorum TaxID=1124835 RepID=A0A3G6MCL6_CHRCU|nr:hypothetical protein EG346_22045 [Chryseobacterium carnipullorum]AZA65556.1 hypothetical protein EG345_13140 [Chryseobacterium carnipullorum]
MKIKDFLHHNSTSVKPILMSRDLHSPLSEGCQKFKEFLTGWFKTEQISTTKVTKVFKHFSYFKLKDCVQEVHLSFQGNL